MTTMKLAVLALVVACATAVPVQYGQVAVPSAQLSYGPVQQLPAYQQEPYEERNYKVYYSVKDDPSYNYQTRNEEKNGNTVTGQYTVLEPTGELRVVNYIADDYGFRADVQNQAGYGPAAPVHAAPSYGAQAPSYGAPAPSYAVQAPVRSY